MKQRIKWWLFLIVALLMNAWVLIERNNGYKYFPYKTYSQLYISDSTLRITSIKFSDSTLNLRFSYPLSANEWKLYTDSSFTKNITSFQDKISVPLTNNSHHYTLRPESNSTLPITLIVDHAPHTEGFDNEFIYCNIPGPDLDYMPLKTWQTRPVFFSEHERFEGDRLLRDSIRILPGDDDFSKTIKIGRFLRQLRYDSNGIYVNDLKLTLPEQIKLSLKSKVNIICGNYTSMFHFLGSLAGLTTRTVTYRGPDGNWHYGIHYLNEVYLHKEQQWALVDIANNIFLPHDSTRYYNVVDIQKMTRVNGFANKFTYDLNNDSTTLLPYDKVNYFHRYYNMSNSDICFSHHDGRQKSALTLLWHFYYPGRDYSFYSDTKTNNIFKIFLKYLFLTGLVTGIVAYIFWEISSRKRRVLNRGSKKIIT